MSNQVLGQWGEDEAVRFLEGKGYEVVARNYRARMGEIDIVAQKDGAYVFIEVKTRHSSAYGWPEEAVNETKRQRMYQCGLRFLSERGEDAPYSFDVVSILRFPDGTVQVKHLEGV